MEDKEVGTNAGVSGVGNDPSGDLAYQQLLPELDAVPRDELVPITVDVPSVVTLVVGSLPEILHVVGAIQKVAPELDAARIQRLRTYALALNYAHARYLSAAPARNNLDALVTEATQRFATLSTDAAALVKRGLINGEELEDLGSPAGYKSVAVALTRFATVLTASWDKIEGKCAITREELDSTLRLAELILTTVGLKEQGATKLDSATDYRLRAFFLLSREYDRVRQAVTFVRWTERDADQIAPSIYTGRTARRREANVPASDPVPAATPTGDASKAGTPEVPGPVPNQVPPTGLSPAKENPRADPFMRGP
ncbi:MAG TPA: hypothetical protein VFQ35_25975 [Polyangiaceae bacterium]|nr:hypothetical protein [Polyangiaceae bacterium]